jgi:hypothetical protein
VVLCAGTDVLLFNGFKLTEESFLSVYKCKRCGAICCNSRNGNAFRLLSPRYSYVADNREEGEIE